VTVTVAPSPSATTASGPSSPLTLEKQHITHAAVEGIVPTLQNIVPTQVSTQVYSSCTSDANGSIQYYHFVCFLFSFSLGNVTVYNRPLNAESAEDDRGLSEHHDNMLVFKLIIDIKSNKQQIKDTEEIVCCSGRQG
jgi:hypothetical protein